MVMRVKVNGLWSFVLEGYLHESGLLRAREIIGV